MLLCPHNMSHRILLSTFFFLHSFSCAMKFDVLIKIFLSAFVGGGNFSRFFSQLWFFNKDQRKNIRFQTEVNSWDFAFTRVIHVLLHSRVFFFRVTVSQNNLHIFFFPMPQSHVSIINTLKKRKKKKNIISCGFWAATTTVIERWSPNV